MRAASWLDMRPASWLDMRPASWLYMRAASWLYMRVDELMDCSEWINECSVPASCPERRDFVQKLDSTTLERCHGFSDIRDGECDC